MTGPLCWASLQRWTMLMLCTPKCRLEGNAGTTEECQETQMRFINQHSAHETSNYSFKTAAWGKKWLCGVPTIHLMQLSSKVHEFKHFQWTELCPNHPRILQDTAHTFKLRSTADWHTKRYSNFPVTRDKIRVSNVCMASSHHRSVTFFPLSWSPEVNL